MRVRGPKFEVFGTSNQELHVALFSLVSFESDIGDYSRSIMNMFGIGLARA
jgi:hypothetical protein